MYCVLFRYHPGYVFGRELEYELGGEERSFGDSFVIEAGLSF